MKNTDNIPWVEKYRPTQFKNIVLDDMNRKIFDNILEKQYFPNLLFYGPPGTGKTTTIINMIDNYNKRYSKNSKGAVMHLNASDERGIDIIRNNILQFVKTNNFFENCVKFVILDEVDYMTKNAQQALKYLLQSSNYNVRFCLICNYISKIDESLKNEFLCIRFNQLPKNEIHTFIQDICEKESIKITESQTTKLLDTYNSDIRSMINFIQLNKDNMDNPDFILSNDIWEKLHGFIVNQAEYHIIIEFIHSISINYNCDKKTIIKKYMDYLVRYKREYITKDFCHLCETILHSPEIDMQLLLKHTIYKLQKLFQL
jgi:replication factor C subunit 3/5